MVDLGSPPLCGLAGTMDSFTHKLTAAAMKLRTFLRMELTQQPSLTFNAAAILGNFSEFAWREIRS